MGWHGLPTERKSGSLPLTKASGELCMLSICPEKNAFLRAFLARLRSSVRHATDVCFSNERQIGRKLKDSSTARRNRGNCHGLIFRCLPDCRLTGRLCYSARWAKREVPPTEFTFEGPTAPQ